MLTIARRALFLLTLPALCLALAVAEGLIMSVHALLGEAYSMRLTGAVVAGAVSTLRLLTGTRITIRGSVPAAPSERPLILVANHQPPFDMILLAFVFREHLPAFITRTGMHRFIPLVSRYLRVTRSLPVDLQGSMRNLPRQLRMLAQRAQERCSGVAIFPEGITPWGGSAYPRPFRRAGLRRLLLALPDALVVPVVFDGCERLARSGTWLDLAGEEVNLTILPSLDRTTPTVDDLIATCERAIHAEQLRLLGQRERASTRDRDAGHILTSHGHELTQELEAPWT